MFYTIQTNKYKMNIVTTWTECTAWTKILQVTVKNAKNKNDFKVHRPKNELNTAHCIKHCPIQLGMV
jgi:hypothetical protein